MPPPRRGARRRNAAAAKSTRASRRLSVRRGEPFKRGSRGGGGAAAAGDDDGLPLSDESLLLVFSAISATIADLVRCAATCRRWRRLVSADAAFICRRATPRVADPFVRSLALGFFHSRTDAAAPPRFAPLSAAGARLQPSLAALVGGASRVVASRNGRFVLDLRRRASARTTHAVRLGVCNPVTAGCGGSVDVLPPLRGRDSPTGPYACTVITAADERGSEGWHHASYRVLLLYNRRSFTALRCYSSDAGSWGPEAVVTGARIGRNQLAVGPHAAVVHHGVVFWPRLAIALRLDSLQPPRPAVSAAKSKGKTPPPRHTVAGFSPAARQRPSSQATKAERLLGVTPDGRMLRVEADSETIRAYCGRDADAADGDIRGASLTGEKLDWKWTMKQALMRVHTVRLRWLCEKSGLVIFTARNGGDPDTHVYTVDVETKQFRRVATCSEATSSGEMCGYEMDRVTLLTSLGR
ncbi:hypothetical protein C2845_PM13G03780 [Panicum miliaceum]|uniref:F-box domain-containing protein n=1 Tax=Panicum miliaceum TaxID=4540 RepID=A0A3L6RNW8_PANMI|nr:hypothetical protein C2845_PM13G03780 [Panicum miliaceum]